MNTSQIEWFCAAYESGSFAKAAVEAYVSRQAFGKAIRSLEGELGVTLFDRDEFGSKPTEAARALYPLMKRMYNTNIAIKETCVSLRRDNREPVRIAVADGIVESLPRGFFDALDAACPQAEILVEKHFYRRCLELLKAGAVDFAICAGPLDEPTLSKVLLAQEPAYLGMSQATAQRYQTAVTLEDYADLLLYSIGPDASGSMGLISAFERRGIQPRVDRRYSEYNMILEKVAQGAGVVMVPENVASHARDLGICLVPIPDGEVNWRVYFLYEEHERSAAKAAALSFMQQRGL